MDMDRGPAGPVIFFDGVCALCNGFVDFVLARDRGAVFRFAPLQGETAAGVLRGGAPAASGEDAEAGDWMNSMVLRDKDGLHRRSEAALRILMGLGGPWRLLGIFRLVPLPWRDGAYNLLARNRYRWFGKHDICRMPAPTERERFLP